jgi:Zn-dependent protease
MEELMKTSIQIGKIMGIPIRLYITFLLILPVFAWIFARSESELGAAGIGKMFAIFIGIFGFYYTVSGLRS